jgi:hypothetical protein
MDLETGHARLVERINELRQIATTEGPLVFVCASAFLEYVAKLAQGQDCGGRGYKDFIETWMSRARPEYKDFRYRSGQTDLPVQMYHVLSCHLSGYTGP